MGHVFSSPQDNSGNQRLTAEEAKELIRNHQSREVEMDGRVSVKDLAETLNVPTWQVEQMVQEMRSKSRQAQQPTPGGPMPSSVWLKTRLWIWAAISLGGMWLTGHGIGAAIRGISHIPAFVNLPHIQTPKIRINNGGTPSLNYPSSAMEMGEKLGIQAPGGFSYKIAEGNLTAAVLGEKHSYMKVAKLSDENVTLVQKQYAENILQAFDKAVAKNPPTWIDGEAVALMELNYYPGGSPVSVDLTLNKRAFPVTPSNPASAALRKQILEGIEDNWDEVTDEVDPDDG